MTSWLDDRTTSARLLGVAGVDWGTVPDWLAGVGALAAVVFAAMAARAALRTNDQQTYQLAQLERSEQRRADTERRALASSVTAWVRAERDEPAEVNFINGGRLPVYNLAVVLTCSSQRATIHYAVRGPHADPIMMKRVTLELRRMLSEEGVRENNDWQPLVARGLLTVAISFMDSNGSWWARYAEGELTEFPDRLAAQCAISAEHRRRSH